MNAFEAHIVAYGKSDLRNIPEGFFLNSVNASSQGFSGIATVETNDIETAYEAWLLGSEWSKRQLAEQSEFGCHMKLEQWRESTPIRRSPLKRLPRGREKPQTFETVLVGAWDTHLDGDYIHPDLRKWLIEERGYILLDYVSRSGRQCQTLTLHFLQRDKCQEEYDYIVPEIKECGGFNGTIYWEDPLAFVVFGPTTPRPVVI